MGKQGQKGEKGNTGARGATGAPGAVGATGRAAPEDSVNALASVHDEIDHIHQELDVQMMRMAQVQMELDEVRATLKRLMDESN